MAREGTPVLGLSFQWVFMPFMLLLVSLVLRSLWGIAEALRKQDVIDLFAREGGDAVGSTADQFTAYVKSEIARWAKLIKATGTRID